MKVIDAKNWCPDVVISVLAKDVDEAKTLAFELETVAKRFYGDRHVRIAIEYDVITDRDVKRIVDRVDDLPG